LVEELALSVALWLVLRREIKVLGFDFCCVSVVKQRLGSHRHRGHSALKFWVTIKNPQHPWHVLFCPGVDRRTNAIETSSHNRYGTDQPAWDGSGHLLQCPSSGYLWNSQDREPASRCAAKSVRW